MVYCVNFSSLAYAEMHASVVDKVQNLHWLDGKAQQSNVIRINVHCTVSAKHISKMHVNFPMSLGNTYVQDSHWCLEAGLH